jgi:hypothetical protein
LTSWTATIAVISERGQPTIDQFTKIGWRSVYPDEDGSICWRRTDDRPGWH